MYQAGKKRKSRGHRVVGWSIFGVCCLVALVMAGIAIHNKLKPRTAISQSRVTVTKVTYDTKTKHYAEGDFTIDLPNSWHPVARQPGPYQSFTWQSSDVGSDGQIIVVYEDTIPVNFAANRVQIVHGEVDHLGLDGSVSDNCSTFTGDVTPLPNQVGVPAKWQGVSFFCDQKNTERDVIGTSSTDGVNMVSLKDQSTGKNHKFFFTYTDYSINPDYSVFANVLNSFRMN